MVYCEIFIQVPFFLVAAYAYLAGERAPAACTLGPTPPSPPQASALPVNSSVPHTAPPVLTPSLAHPRTTPPPPAGTGWNGIRIPAIMYGVHAATTVVPMLADIWAGAAVTHTLARVGARGGGGG
jgi:hypothetical protein